MIMKPSRALWGVRNVQKSTRQTLAQSPTLLPCNTPSRPRPSGRECSFAPTIVHCGSRTGSAEFNVNIRKDGLELTSGNESSVYNYKWLIDHGHLLHGENGYLAKSSEDRFRAETRASTSFYPRSAIIKENTLIIEWDSPVSLKTICDPDCLKQFGYNSARQSISSPQNVTRAKFKVDPGKNLWNFDKSDDMLEVIDFRNENDVTTMKSSTLLRLEKYGFVRIKVPQARERDFTKIILGQEVDDFNIVLRQPASASGFRTIQPQNIAPIRTVIYSPPHIDGEHLSISIADGLSIINHLHEHNQNAFNFLRTFPVKFASSDGKQRLTTPIFELTGSHGGSCAQPYDEKFLMCIRYCENHRTLLGLDIQQQSMNLFYDQHFPSLMELLDDANYQHRIEIRDDEMLIVDNNRVLQRPESEGMICYVK